MVQRQVTKATEEARQDMDDDFQYSLNVNICVCTV